MYELVCGLETHVELSTKTKIFCSCATAFGGKPNSRCCPVCTGMPGALPVLNRTVVEYAVRAGLATHCSISNVTRLDRKHYCYPDLPKAYQISQSELPLCVGGAIELDSGKRIRINRIHIEEDAGKLVHEGGATFIDYNRCGVPLIEIVSEPDISSAEEAREYLEKLQILMRYIGVSDCKMQEGSMRADVNVSLRKTGERKLGVRTEIKNMSSLSFIVKAIRFEAARQQAVLEGGGAIEQVTLRYNEETGETETMRGKETAKDYRFFPEPDLPAVRILEEEIERIRSSLPELPMQKLRRYEELGLAEFTAKLLCPYRRVTEYFEAVLQQGGSAKTTANLIVGTVYATFRTEEEKERFLLAVPVEELATLVRFVDEGKLRFGKASEVLSKMLASGLPVSHYLSEEDLTPMGKEELYALCAEAIEKNPAAARDVLAGKVKAKGALIGYVMKGSKGRADLSEAERIFAELLK
ncbi:MAG: Asp-tRNA(Asn)/Glu-tRNA(Gln) amidotransferase subunit GatB [Christensenellaceae bacterium]